MDDFLGACKAGRIDVVRAFFADQTPQQKQNGLVEAIDATQLDVIAFLLDNGVQLDALCLDLAGMTDSPQIYACMLQHGWDINMVIEDNTALRFVHATVSTRLT